VWGKIITTLVSLVIVCSFIIMGTFRWMSRNVLTDPCFDKFHNLKKEQRAKHKLSVKESFAYISNSKYLMCIAVLVVAYNLVINMTEVLWKDQLARLYPSPTDYNVYVNNLTSCIGVLATLTALFMARIIDKLGWTRTAMVTPIMMAITCAGLFAFLLFQKEWLVALPSLMNWASPLAIAVFFGTAQNCLSKAAKYSVFDTTKEMAFIPLSYECKLKGKAAIDGVGSRIGKSGGSILFQGLLMFFATVSASAPYVAVVLAVVIALWIVAVRMLGKQFNALVATQEVAEPKSEWKADAPAPQTVTS
jgi:ATP:ADP antiporter, AAA family